MGELMGKGRLNPDGNMGFAAILSFSSSASCSLLALALRFWNQILTWVSVRLRELENSALSAMDRYCFWRNLRSRASSWEVVNGVRGFLFVLCFLRVQAVGLRCPGRKGKAGYHKSRETWVLWRDVALEKAGAGREGYVKRASCQVIPSKQGILLQVALEIFFWPSLCSQDFSRCPRKWNFASVISKGLLVGKQSTKGLQIHMQQLALGVQSKQTSSH